MHRRIRQLHLLRAVVLTGAVGVGCAGITGISEYRVVPDAPDAADALAPGVDGGPGVTIGPDGAVIPNDASTQSDASHPDASFDGAAPFAPSCGRVDCTGVAGTCTNDTCNGTNDPWTKDAELEISAGRCRAKGHSAARVMITTQATVTGRYQFELSFDLVDPGDKGDNAIAEIQAGSGVVQLVEVDDKTFKLCTSGGVCSAAFDAFNQPTAGALHVDIYGVWGEGVAGNAVVVVGATTCAEGASIALGAQIGSTLTVGVGTDQTGGAAGPAPNVEFANVTFSTRPF